MGLFKKTHIYLNKEFFLHLNFIFFFCNKYFFEALFKKITIIHHIPKYNIV